MAPKAKGKQLAATGSKKIATLTKQKPVDISASTLLCVPSNAVQGYQERIEKGVEWTISELARRHHVAQLEQELPVITFSRAFENKIEKSVLRGFFDTESTLSLEEQYDIIVPMAFYDSEKSPTEEAKICFRNCNNLTDDLTKLMKQAVRENDVNILWKELYNAQVLRLSDTKMTELDEGLSKFSHLVTLNLCGNYISRLNCLLLPPDLRILELQLNFISELDSLSNLPTHLLYLGLSKNLLTNESGLGIFSNMPNQLTVLDLSDNDIYHLEPLITVLSVLSNLTSLMLAGNPCAMATGYAHYIFYHMRHLKYLDNREILQKDHHEHEPPADDLRYTHFCFSVLRIMSAPIPPKPEKGTVGTFYVEFELPLLDKERRMFLMYRRFESLIEMEPPAEDDFSSLNVTKISKDKVSTEHSKENDSVGEESEDIFARMEPRNLREIHHFTTYETNRVAWNQIMYFQDPAVKIFCPDLTAIRNTFRSVVTLRLVYSVISPTQKSSHKLDKKMGSKMMGPVEQRVTIATIRCALNRCDWSQNFQHFHWDDSMGTNDALHWGEGDLSALQYSPHGVKQVPKGTPDAAHTKAIVPENLTCHFSFGIETLKLN